MSAVCTAFRGNVLQFKQQSLVFKSPSRETVCAVINSLSSRFTNLTPQTVSGDLHKSQLTWWTVLNTVDIMYKLFYPKNSIHAATRTIISVILLYYYTRSCIFSQCGTNVNSLFRGCTNNGCTDGVKYWVLFTVKCLCVNDVNMLILFILEN